MSEQPNDPGGMPPQDETTPPPGDPAGEAAAPPTADEKNMALVAHLLGILLSVLGPLIIWLIKKDESPFVNDQGKEALNFQITILIAGLISSVLTTVLIGCVLLPIVIVVNLIFCIIAAMQAKEGVRYRYPFALRLIS